MRKTILIFIACMFRACLSVMAQTLPDTTIAPAKPPGYISIPQPSYGISTLGGGIVNPYIYISSLGKYFDIATTKWVKSNLLKKDITTYNGIGDGTTNTDNALTLAKAAVGTGGEIYFPKKPNTTNTVYYFNSQPSLDGYIISSDEGVSLSFPSTNNTYFGSTKFLNAINIISRDRNHGGVQLRNYELPTNLMPVTSIDKDEQPFNLTSINVQNMVKSAYNVSSDSKTAGTTLAGAPNYIFWANSTMQATSAKDSLSFDVAETPAVLGCEYNVSLNTENTVSGASQGILVSGETEWVYFGIKNNQYTLISKKANTPYTQIFLPNTISKAYVLDNPNGSPSIPELSVRLVSDTELEFYVNGVRIYRYTLAGQAFTVGFGLNRTMNIASATSIYNPVRFETKTPARGRTLRIAVFGDSQSFGEGVDISWPQYLKYALIGRSGISDVIVDNYAISGYTAQMQLDIMQGINLNSYDYTLVAVGTNDIQAKTDLNNFKTTIQNIVTKIRGDGSQEILADPMMYIDAASTGYGFETSNYTLGGNYRSTILRVIADMNGLWATSKKMQGEIGATNKVMSDNIHPLTKFQAVTARAFATALLSDVQRPTTSISLGRGNMRIVGDYKSGSYSAIQSYFSDKTKVGSQLLFNYGNAAFQSDNGDGLKQNMAINQDHSISIPNGPLNVTDVINGGIVNGGNFSFAANPNSVVKRDANGWVKGKALLTDNWDFEERDANTFSLAATGTGYFFDANKQNLTFKLNYTTYVPTIVYTNVTYQPDANYQLLVKSTTDNKTYLLNTNDLPNNNANTRTTDNINISLPGWYTYVGTSNGTWTLPAEPVGSPTFFIKNAGTTPLTINNTGSSFSIYLYGNNTSFTILPGESAIIHFDGVQFQVNNSGKDANGNIIGENTITTAKRNNIEKTPNGSWIWVHTDDDTNRIADAATVVFSNGNATVTLTTGGTTL